MKACPRCNYEIHKDLTECPNCGVVFTKWYAAHPSSLITKDKYSHNINQTAESTWKLLIKTLLPVATVIFCIAWLVFRFWSGGFTPEHTAEVLIHDSEMGGRALERGYSWGDSIFVPLRKISSNYRLLDERNSQRVAMLLVKNSSQTSLALAEELYRRKGNYEKLVGAVGLAAHGELPMQEFESTGFLHQILEHAAGRSQYGPIGIMIIDDQAEIELALIAAKYSMNKNSVNDILAIIQKRPLPYFQHAYAADALGAIGDGQALPALEDAMRATDFSALPNAFCALILLSDKQAVPLAINRITPEIRGKNSEFLIPKLEEVTGQKFGFDQNRWKKWWTSNKNQFEPIDIPCKQDIYRNSKVSHAHHHPTGDTMSEVGCIADCGI